MDDHFFPESMPNGDSPTNRSRSLGGQHLTVTGANQHGIVMEAGRPFEVGATVALGLHVSRGRQRNSRFISAETVVVASQPRFSKDGELVHEVTMLFCDISNRDHRLLLKLSRRKALEKLHAGAPSSDFGPAPVGKYGFSLN